MLLLLLLPLLLLLLRRRLLLLLLEAATTTTTTATTTTTTTPAPTTTTTTATTTPAPTPTSYTGISRLAAAAELASMYIPKLPEPISKPAGPPSAAASGPRYLLPPAPRLQSLGFLVFFWGFGVFNPWVFWGAERLRKG